MCGSVARLLSTTSTTPTASSLGSASLASAKAAARQRPRSGLQKQVLGLYRRYVRAIREKELPAETKRQVAKHVREQVGAGWPALPFFPLPARPCPLCVVCVCACVCVCIRPR